MAFLACRNVTSEDVGTIWLPNRQVVGQNHLLFDGKHHRWRFIPDNPAFVIEIKSSIVIYTILFKDQLHMADVHESDFLSCYGRMTDDLTDAR